MQRMKNKTKISTEPQTPHKLRSHLAVRARPPFNGIGVIVNLKEEVWFKAILLQREAEEKALGMIVQQLLKKVSKGQLWG